jgi:hypothetical protein
MPPAVPWSKLPSSLADVLRPVLPDAVDATVTAIRREVPPYRRAWQADVDRTVRRGVEIALRRMLELLGTEEAALDDRARRFYRALGTGESQQGRSLDALLSAYRTGARVNWETMSAAATAAGVATQDLIALAESIFVYIDELSSVSAEGHAAADAARSGYRDAARVRLATALLAGEAGAAPARVAELADAAGWRVPQSMAVAVVPAAATGRVPPSSVPPDVLLADGDEELVAIVPDPTGPGRARALTRLMAGAEVYVGTVRPPAEAPISLTHARRLRRLVAAGAVPGGSVVLAARHLPELLITADPVLPDDLAARVLAPLLEVTPSRRRALRLTLSSWLAHMGDRAAVAADLVVHPQTVSYRMGRLQDLFGDALADPDQRFALHLALRLTDGQG